MKNHIVYFEIYGKKMKTTIPADSKEQAKEAIKSKIIFHKVVGEEEDVMEKLRDMFNMKP